MSLFQCTQVFDCVKSLWCPVNVLDYRKRPIRLVSIFAAYTLIHDHDLISHGIIKLMCCVFSFTLVLLTCFCPLSHILLQSAMCWKSKNMSHLNAAATREKLNTVRRREEKLKAASSRNCSIFHCD